jgi:hypothetical protein
MLDYYKLVLKKIEGKYGDENDVFTIDASFKRYYENLRKSNTISSVEKKNELE